GGAPRGRMAGGLISLPEGWGIEGADLVGMDMGGQPALVFAAEHPERVRRLVVMNSLVFGDEATSWEIRVLRRFGWNRWILRHLPRLVFRRALKTFLPRGVHLPEPLRADLWESFRRSEVRAFIAKLCAGYQRSLAKLPELYRQVACPTLVLWAERDKHFPLVHARRLHETIAGSKLEIIGGAEHWMAWHRAEEVAERIRGFVAESPGK